MKFTGKQLYEAYCEICGGIAFNGDKLSCFENVRENIQNNWNMLAEYCNQFN